MVTSDLIKRIAEAEWTWNKHAQRKWRCSREIREGFNSIQSFDHVAAVTAHGTESHLFNRAVGLCQGDGKLIAKIASYFWGLKRPCFVAALPGHCDYLLGQSLHKSNFYPSNVFTALFEKPDGIREDQI